MKSKLIYVFAIVVIFLLMAIELQAQTIDEGVAFIQSGKFAEARKVFEQIIEKDDKNAEAHFQLGQIFLNRAYAERNVDEAVDQLEKAVDLNPNNADYQYGYGAALGEKAQHAGVIKQAFLAPKIKNAFKRAVELNPQHVRARIGLAQYYIMAPSIMGGDEEEGWRQLDEAIKINELEGRFVKASMLARAKKSNEANEEYKTLVASKPKEWRAWKAYGNFCLRNERFDEAIKLFQKYVELRPDTADSFHSLGQGFLKKGDTEHAITMFRKAFELDKKYLSSLEYMGDAYQMKGQKKEAKEMYQAVLGHNDLNDSYRKKVENKLKEVE